MLMVRGKRRLQTADPHSKAWPNRTHRPRLKRLKNGIVQLLQIRSWLGGGGATSPPKTSIAMPAAGNGAEPTRSSILAAAPTLKVKLTDWHNWPRTNSGFRWHWASRPGWRPTCSISRPAIVRLKAGSKVSQLRHLAESVGQMIQQGQRLTGPVEDRFAVDLKTRAS